MKKRALKSAAQILATPNKYKTSKMVKLGILFFYSRHTKTNFLATTRIQKEDTKKISLFQEQRKQNRKK
jgi:hypothetical protein